MATMYIDTIATHTGTGAASAHKLGADGTPGKQSNIAGEKRIIQVSGTFSGTISLQVSNDDVTYDDLLTGITAPNMYVVVDPHPYLRSNCTSFSSGQIDVTASKLVED